MAKRQTVPQELPRPSLTLPRAEAENKLTKRIEQGQELLARSINNQEELDQAEAAKNKWHDYNRELLGVIFDNEKFAQEYENNSHPTMYVWDETSFFDDVKDFKKSIERKLSAIGSIQERLDLMPEYTGTLRSYKAVEPPRKSPGSYTLNISGGTVMLGDGNQVSNITVRDIITELENEVAKLPETSEKQEALKGLQVLTSNETFASVTGAALGSFLSSWLR